MEQTAITEMSIWTITEYSIFLPPLGLINQQQNYTLIRIFLMLTDKHQCQEDLI